MSSALPSEPQEPDVGCPSVDDLSRFIEKTVSPATGERILAHLDTCEPCRLLMAVTLRDTELDKQSGMACPPRTFSAGEIVGGRYRVVRLIARGGMGEVYEASDLQLRETVALKTVACTGLDNVALNLRIRKEVQLARKVTHPNVCRILEFGLHQQVYRNQQETIPFFTMELLDGETLADYIGRRKRLPMGELRPIALQIAQGLSAIHAAGIVHRDLKPENIFLLTGTAGDMRAVVMDFGLARNQEGRGSVNESSSNSTVGTPSYMAPEQSLGSTPSVAWDIFAFGVILFRATSGELPFKGSNPVALAIARLREPAPKLSALVPDVDPVLEHIVARCLQREPAHRFASVGEIQRALMDLRLRPAAHRHRPWAMALVLAASVAAATIGRWIFGSEPEGKSVTPGPATTLPRPNPRRESLATFEALSSASPLPSQAPAVSAEHRSAPFPAGSRPEHREAKHGSRQSSLPRRVRQATAASNGKPAPTQAAVFASASRSAALVPADDEIAIPSFAESSHVRSGGEK